MNQDQEDRIRRNHVSNMYDNPTWHARVAGMSREQITAIYLRSIRDGKKPQLEAAPKAPLKPKKPEDPQIRLF